MRRTGKGDHVGLAAGTLGKLVQEVGGHQLDVREFPDETQAFAIGPRPNYYTVALYVNRARSIHKYSHGEPPCGFCVIPSKGQPRRKPQPCYEYPLSRRTKSGRVEVFQIGSETVHRFPAVALQRPLDVRRGSVAGVIDSTTSLARVQ